MARSSKKGGKRGAVKTRKAARKPAKIRRPVRLATRLKRPAASKIELKETREQQAATADILKIIAKSRSDVQPVFHAIAKSANRLLGGFSTAVFRFIDAAAHLAAFTPISPTADKALRASFPRPIAEIEHFRLAAAGKVLQIADTEDQPDAPLKAVGRSRGYRSILFVPLNSLGGTMGTITVTRKDPGTFSTHHVQLLQNFADQAVIAVENARLFNETKEALERQTATADILKVIASSPNDVQPVFDAIAASANRLMGGFSTAVHRVIDDLVHLVAFTPTDSQSDEALEQSFPMHLGVMPTALVQQGETVQIADSEGADPAIQRLARTRGWRSITFTPLVNQGRFIGYITSTRKDPGVLADHHVQLLRAFADQAVIAIENARLFNETKEALERQTATADILKVIASSPNDVQPVFAAIAERSNRLVNGLATAVYRRQGDMLHLMAFTPVSPEADASLQSSFPAPVSLFGWDELIEAGGTNVVADAEVEFATRPTLLKISRMRGWRSTLSVLLMRDKEAIGVITVTRVEPGGFNDYHVQLLQTFADQAVIAISNTELFQEVQQRTLDLSKSLDDLRAAQDRLVQTEKLASLGQLTAGIAHEIKNPLNFVNNFSALSVELTDELNDALKQASLAQQLRQEVDELTSLLKSNLEKIVQHGRRADSIVKNMLLHSREGSTERRSAEVNRLVEESLNLAYHGARAEKTGFTITLKHDLDPEAGALDLYPQEMTRALLNLISNGFYAATKRKAEASDETFEPVLSAATRNLGGTIEIRIRDNGTGIPPEVREKMFNPFFTTKPTGEGTGLGLSMTHDIIVKQHGGKIDVETEPGAFTEFIITLPRDIRTASG
jgi:signal transduction histidine kinase